MKSVLEFKTGGLDALLDKAASLNDLHQLVQPFLSAELRPHCQVANFRRGTLVFEVDNAAWATVLRYATPELISRLRKEGKLYNLRGIESFVQPAGKAAPETPPTHHLSETASQLIVGLASRIKNKKLREALLKLGAKN